MKTRVLLFVAAAVIATLSGALAGALTLPRAEGGSVRDLPPTSSDPRPPPLGPTVPDDEGDEDDNSGPGGGDNSGPG